MEGGESSAERLEHRAQSNQRRLIASAAATAQHWQQQAEVLSRPISRHLTASHGTKHTSRAFWRDTEGTFRVSYGSPGAGATACAFVACGPRSSARGNHRALRSCMRRTAPRAWACWRTGAA